MNKRNGLIVPYIRTAGFVFLFLLISLFPQPIQLEYGFVIRLLMGGLLLILLSFKENRCGVFSRCDWPLWGFVVLLISGTIHALDKAMAVRTYASWVSAIVCLYYIGKLYARTHTGRRTVAVSIGCVGLLIVILSVAEIVTGRNIAYEHFIANPYYDRYIIGLVRPMATMYNPVCLGTYLVGCLAFLFVLVSGKKGARRIWITAGIIICGLVIMLTLSRGILLALVAFFAAYLWLKKRRRDLGILLGAIFFIVLAGSIIREGNFARFGFTRLVFGAHDSVFSDYRLSRLRMAGRIVERYPFTGVGFHHFRIRYEEFCETGQEKETHEFRIPDNLYLSLLTETGLLGLGGFLMFVLILLRRAFQAVRATADKRGRNFLVCCVSLFVAYLVNMGAYDVLYWETPLMFFSLICGFLAANQPSGRPLQAG